MSAAETCAPLPERIAQALAEASQTFPAVGIASLISDTIADTKDELQRLSCQRDTARKLSLDPRAPADAVAQARQDHEALLFESERLEVALEYLQRAHAIALKREDDAAARARLAQATADRDALAQELRDTYPKLAGEIAELFARIKAFDASRPAGIDPVESAARGIKPNGIHWLLGSVALPAFDPDAHARGRSLWPPPIVHIVPPSPNMVESFAARAAYSRQAAEGAAAQKREEAGRATRRIP